MRFSSSLTRWALGAAAVTFHDDDLVPDDATREETLKRFRQALDETGLVVPRRPTV